MSFLEPFVYGVEELDVQGEGQLLGLVCGYVLADGGCLKRYFSRRAIIQGGLLLSPDCTESALAALLAHVKKNLASHVVYIEIRNQIDYIHFREIFTKNDFLYQPHLNFLVDTRDEICMFAHFSKTKRRQIRRSFDKGELWSETTDSNDIKEYYNILSKLYRTKIKTPLFPIEFFTKLIQHSYGKLLVVKRNGRVTGGMVCAVWKERVVYEWFVCGGVMATYAGLQYAAQKRISTFDFMGAGQPDIPYGVRNFKARFGGQLVEYGRFLYICKPKLYVLGKCYIRFIKMFV